MIIQDEITDYAVTLYAFLPNDHGFQLPVIKKENWSTRITYKKGNIAIEIELDFRELSVLLSVLRLDDGNLPSGYYLSSGKKSRIYLLLLISEKKWDVDITTQSILKSRVSRVNRDTNYFKERLEQNRIILQDCVKKIIDLGENIFI